MRTSSLFHRHYTNFRRVLFDSIVSDCIFSLLSYNIIVVRKVVRIANVIWYETNVSAPITNAFSTTYHTFPTGWRRDLISYDMLYNIVVMKNVSFL